MSIRQLATLGRRAVLSHNVRIVEGPAALRNQRYFSQGGKVFNEEEKAQENIFIKVSHLFVKQPHAMKLVVHLSPWQDTVAEQRHAIRLAVRHQVV